jgi:hypothetical protein
VLKQIEAGSARKWQRSWAETIKGRRTKEYFPDINERKKMKLNFSGNLTTVLTGHGNIKAYLHNFHISKEQMCPCGEGGQTTEHIIYDCV